jgi:hypothetical protein
MWKFFWFSVFFVVLEAVHDHLRGTKIYMPRTHKKNGYVWDRLTKIMKGFGLLCALLVLSDMSNLSFWNILILYLIPRLLLFDPIIEILRKNIKFPLTTKDLRFLIRNTETFKLIRLFRGDHK